MDEEMQGDVRLAKNYRGIKLTSIAAKIFNALLSNRIDPKIDNILRKNQNGFRRNRSTTSQILTIRRILEDVRAKNLQATIFSDVLLSTPTHGRAKEGRPARTYLQQLGEDTGCSPEDLPNAMNDREGW